MSSFLLQGDPTYLVVEADGTIGNYGVNAVCTHLGCVVPWVAVSAICVVDSQHYINHTFGCMPSSIKEIWAEAASRKLLYSPPGRSFPAVCCSERQTCEICHLQINLLNCCFDISYGCLRVPCCRLRTSSSAHATVLSTTTRARSFVALLLW